MKLEPVIKTEPVDSIKTEPGIKQEPMDTFSIKEEPIKVKQESVKQEPDVKPPTSATNRFAILAFIYFELTQINLSIFNVYNVLTVIMIIHY